MGEDAEKIYFEYRNHLVESRRQSYQQFDRAVFLLSGGGLTVSLTLLKNIIPFKAAEYKILLASTWTFFTLPIMLTLLSFIFSRRALDKQIQYAEEYFVKKERDAFDKKNIEARVTEYLNYSSGVSFFIGVVSLLLFVYLNIL